MGRRLAVIGAIVGRTIGWDPSESDENPALWPPYVVTIVLLVGWWVILVVSG